MPSWGTFFGTIADAFGTKAERRRNAITRLEKQRDELKKKPATIDNRRKYDYIIRKLRFFEKAAQNS